MPRSGQSSEHTTADPTRIVYYAEDKTFARLFNERSLEELKAVVRRKLGLGNDVNVSLKQMGAGALLDLEDDDDFQAFRVFLKSCVSVDIQVTVGKSQGPSTLSPVVPHPRPPENALERESTTALLPPKQAGTAASGQPDLVPHSSPVQPAANERKRKASSGDTRKKTKTSLHSRLKKPSMERTPSPDPMKLDDEHPKKKQKTAVTKEKGLKSAQATEGSPAADVASKPTAKRSVTSQGGSEAAAKVSKVVETPRPPVRKQTRKKKDDDDAIQPEPEKLGGSVTGGSTLKTKMSKPKGTVCASIPKTSESNIVQSEVTAAILTGALSYSSEAMPTPPKPPAKRKSVRKVTGKSSAVSSTVPATKPTNVLDVNVSVNEVPKAHAEPTLQSDVVNRLSERTLQANDPACPICLEVPFHIRYRCPIVLKGPDAILRRLEELQKANTPDQKSVIKELEGLLRDSKVVTEPSDATSTSMAQSPENSPSPNGSLSRIPSIPTNSYLSEVTVEARDEGSSSESSDDTSEREIEPKELPASRETSDKQPLLVKDDLDTDIRGPAPKQHSILHVLDRIVGNEDSEDEAELEEDPDEETSRLKYPPSGSESDGEESRSSVSAEDTPYIAGSAVQSSAKPVEESANHHGGDVVMKESPDPPVLEGQGDHSSQGTHVESEEHMVVDESAGETDAATVKQSSVPSPGAPTVQPLDAVRDEPKESGQTVVDPSIDQVGDILVPSTDPIEIDIDPIEPANELEPSTVSRLPVADPIEASSEDDGSPFTSVAQSVPKSGVTKRIKTRDGQIPDDETEGPVLLGELEATEEATPFASKGKSRRKDSETPANQTTRKSSRLSSLPLSTSTPAAVALMNHRNKLGTRNGKASKTTTKRSEERPDASQHRTRIAQTPSLIRWETLEEPSSSPSLQLNEPSLYIDELTPSSPQCDNNPTEGQQVNKGKGGPLRKRAPSTLEESSQGKERLFDLTPSQVPFPYSQFQNDLAPTELPNGKDEADTSDSDSEPKAANGKRQPARYRPLTQLASQATLFSPTLPTPTPKGISNAKARKHVAEEDSSSSSSDSDEADASKHIPHGRRAGSVLESKRKGLLSRV